MSKPGETDHGKGSFPRTWNSETFRNNFAEINWSKKPAHDADYYINAGYEPSLCVDPQCPWHGKEFVGDRPE